VTKPINGRQRAFAEAYAECGNAAESARRAGYVDGRGNSSIRTTGARLLAHAGVRAAIQALGEAAAADRVANRQERLEMLTTIVRAKDVEARDRIKAAELMAKMAGDLVEKVEHSGTGVAAVVVRFPVNALGDGQG
jgi:phage terminase small subunit